MWPFKRKAEHRAAGYTEMQIDALLRAATGSGAAAHTGAATIRACAWRWATALGSLDWTGIGKAEIHQVAHDLILRGASRWLRRQDGLIRVSAAAKVAGGWQVTIPRSDGTDAGETVRALDGEVVNFRWSPEPSRPWDSVAPWAGATATAAAELDGMIAAEAAGPAGQLLAVQAGIFDPAAQTDEGQKIAAQIAHLGKAKRGGLFTWIDQSGGGARVTGSSTGGVQPARVGFAPPAGLAALRNGRLNDDLASACAVPPILLTASSSGPALQAAARQWRAAVAERAALIAAEMDGVTVAPPPVSIEDIAAQGRAMKQLTESGLTTAEAREIVGLPPAAA